ncbi:unnamed protein product [Owenia fusiformis]|uniref:Torsin-1A-interacting protein 1/2 AAA+ activator domain-containing protein n=1 Tax=Owenia fusiformis TaxID=6347 RepID=A0A8S4NZH1_OWEFU|nr:unnamed protein product [Owenia fusiformis]
MPRKRKDRSLVDSSLESDDLNGSYRSYRAERSEDDESLNSESEDDKHHVSSESLDQSTDSKDVPIAGRTRNRLYPNLEDHISSRPSIHSDASPTRSPRPKRSPRRAANSPRGDLSDHSFTSVCSSPKYPQSSPIYPKLDRSVIGESVEDATPENDESGSYVCLFIVAVLVFVAAIYFSGLMSREIPPPEPINILADFDSLMHNLKSTFKSQDRRLFVSTSSAIKPVLKSWVEKRETLKSPAVVMIAAVSGAMEATECFSNRILSSLQKYSNSTSIVEIHSSRLPKNPDQAKLEVDDKLRDGFSKGNKVAEITNLDLMPASAGLMLHAFCDNENAPYKDVVYFFILQLDSTYISVSDWDGAVERFLIKRWEKELGTDEMHALLSRIANSVVVVSPENNDVLKAHCP